MPMFEKQSQRLGGYLTAIFVAAGIGAVAEKAISARYGVAPQFRHALAQEMTYPPSQVVVCVDPSYTVLQAISQLRRIPPSMERDLGGSAREELEKSVEWVLYKKNPNLETDIAKALAGADNCIKLNVPPKMADWYR